MGSNTPPRQQGCVCVMCVLNGSYVDRPDVTHGRQTCKHSRHTQTHYGGALAVVAGGGSDGWKG